MKSVSLTTLRDMKAKGEKFTCVTAYDSTFAHTISQAGVETLLVGDSLGNVMQGHDSTVPVTLDDMVYHTACVARGNTNALIIADMPFMTYVRIEDALEGAKRLMQAGAHVIKLEGGAWLADTVVQFARGGIPTCVHMGLTPQSVNVFGGYKVQGRGEEAAERMLAEAKILDEAGTALFVFECIPTDLATRITKAVQAPVIGIGAGPHCDAQVLVMQDLLGLHPGKPAKFVKNFMTESTEGIAGAFRAYVSAVKEGRYPGPEHSFE